MATLDIKSAATEPQLNLLMPKGSIDQPLWKSLFQNLDDFFFPKKLPPLVLTSRPVPVKDIWGFYDYKKNGALGSTLVHVVVIGAIISITLIGRRVVTEITKPHETVTLVAPEDAYLKNESTLACLGDAAAFPIGIPTTTLRKLGCRAVARPDDILARLLKVVPVDESEAGPGGKLPKLFRSANLG